jgi:hypothetical protein
MDNCLATRQARALWRLSSTGRRDCPAAVLWCMPKVCAQPSWWMTVLGSPAGRSRIRRTLEVGAEPEPGRCLSSGQLAQQPAGPIPQLDHHVVASA